MTPEEYQRMQAAVMRQLQPQAASPFASPYMDEARDSKRAALQARANADTGAMESMLSDRQAYANALRGAEMPQGRNVGPLDVYMGPNWGESLAAAARPVMAGLMQRGIKEDAKGLSKAREDATQAQNDLEQMDLEDARRREDQIRQEEQDFEAKQNELKLSAKVSADGKAGKPNYHITTQEDEYGNSLVIKVDRTGENGNIVEFADGTPYSAEAAKERSKASANTTRGNAFAKSEGQSDSEQLANLRESLPGLRNQISEYNNAIEAVAGGADTGPIAGRLMSFKQATIALEAAQDTLAMDKISEHTFGSLSEEEAKWLKNVAIPTKMDEKYLGPYLERRQQSAQAILAAHEYEIDYRRAHNGRPPPEESIKKILYARGNIFKTPKEWLTE